MKDYPEVVELCFKDNIQCIIFFVMNTFERLSNVIETRDKSMEARYTLKAWGRGVIPPHFGGMMCCQRSTTLTLFKTLESKKPSPIQDKSEKMEPIYDLREIVYPI